MKRLTSEEIQKVMRDFLLDRPPTIHGEEADDLRRSLAADQEKAKANGYELSIPFEIEVEALGLTGNKFNPNQPRD